MLFLTHASNRMSSDIVPTELHRLLRHHYYNNEPRTSYISMSSSIAWRLITYLWWFLTPSPITSQPTTPRKYLRYTIWTSWLCRHRRDYSSDIKESPINNLSPHIHIHNLGFQSALLFIHNSMIVGNRKAVICGNRWKLRLCLCMFSPTDAQKLLTLVQHMIISIMLDSTSFSNKRSSESMSLASVFTL